MLKWSLCSLFFLSTWILASLGWQILYRSEHLMIIVERFWKSVPRCFTETNIITGKFIREHAGDVAPVVVLIQRKTTLLCTCKLNESFCCTCQIGKIANYVFVYIITRAWGCIGCQIMKGLAWQLQSLETKEASIILMLLGLRMHSPFIKHSLRAIWRGPLICFFPLNYMFIFAAPRRRCTTPSTAFWAWGPQRKQKWFSKHVALCLCSSLRQ